MSRNVSTKAHNCDCTTGPCNHKIKQIKINEHNSYRNCIKYLWKKKIYYSNKWEVDNNENQVNICVGIPGIIGTNSNFLSFKFLSPVFKFNLFFFILNLKNFLFKNLKNKLNAVIFGGFLHFLIDIFTLLGSTKYYCLSKTIYCQTF